MPTVIFTCLASRCGRGLALTAASEFYAVVGMRNECGNKKTAETSVLDGYSGPAMKMMLLACSAVSGCATSEEIVQCKAPGYAFKPQSRSACSFS